MKSGPTHCSACGGELVTRDIAGRPRAVCTSCSVISYVNPIPASAVVVVQHDTILLVKRAIEPKRGFWSLPAGFLEIDETVQECAVRETKEETGLDVALDGIVDAITVFDDPRYVCLLVVFAAHVVGGTIQPGDDAAEVGRFGVAELPPIAFKSHVRVIRGALGQE